MNWKPAEQWAIWDIKSYEEYLEKFCSPLFFSPHIPEDSRRRLESIEKLLHHAYYNYEFWDFARELSLLSLEKVIGECYEAQTGLKRNEEQKLKFLLDWVQKENLSEIVLPHFFEHIKWGRDDTAHKSEFGYGGVLVRQWIDAIVDLINDLYESKDLRMQRKKFAKPIKKWFEKNKGTGILFSIGNLRYTLLDIDLIFIDNKLDPPKYTIAFVPLYDLTPYSEKLIVPQIHFFESSDIRIWKNRSTSKFYDGDVIATLEVIEAGTEKIEFEDWNKQLNSLPMAQHIKRLHIPEFDNLFKVKRRAFHKSSH